MTGPRTACAVPFCRRSTKGTWRWWLCPDHWRLVPMWVKARNRKAKRLLRKAGELAQDERGWWPTSARGERVAHQIGAAAIRHACRRATGL